MNETPAGTPRCAGLTKAGAQCKKAAQLDTEFCAQHQPVEIEKPKRERGGRKVAAKRTGEITPIRRGDQVESPKGKDRKVRKAAKRARQTKAHTAAWAVAKGAELARAQAKAARRKDPAFAAQRAARRVARREAGIAKRLKDEAAFQNGPGGDGAVAS